MKTAEAIVHKDVLGKELYYVKISNGEHSHLINVGKTTYDKVKELDKVQELPLEEPKTEPNKKVKEPKL